MSAQAIGKFAAQKLLRGQLKQYAGKKVETGNDPYYAMVEDPRRPGKFKKVKKQIPAYIPEHDAMILASVRKNAYRLDMCLFNFLGVRFGWEAVIGIVPAAGDAIGAALAVLLFQECCKIDGGLPTSLQMRMLINIALDFCIGLVPLVGDLADAAFKCNTQNLRLLELHLDKKYRPPQAASQQRRVDDREQRRRNRASGIYHPQDPPPATVFEDFSDEDEERRDFVREQGAAPNRRVQQPRPTQQRADERGGWFSALKKGKGRRDRPDVEMAQPAPRNDYRQETGSVRR